MSKAGDPIQRFSESTHIGALNKACKMMKIKKKLYSFSSNDQPQREDDIPVVIVPNIESAAAPMTASPDPPSDRPFTIGTNILRAPAVTPHYHYNHPAHPSVHHTFIHCAHVRIGNTWCQKNEFDIFNKPFRKISTSSHHLTMTIKNLYCYKKVQQFH